MAATILKQNNAEGGANGTTVTLANSALPNAFNRIDIGTSNAIIYDSSWSFGGSTSIKVTQGSTAKPLLFWTWTTAQGDFSAKFGFKYNQLAVSSSIFRMFADDGYVTPTLDVTLTTSNKMYVRDSIGATSGTNSAGVLTPGNDYIAFFRYQTATGSAVITVYPKGSSSVALTANVSVAAATSVNSAYLGLGASTSAAASIWFDDVALGYGDDMTRVDVTNAAPTASAGSAQYVAAGTTITLAGTDADSDGSIASRQWTFVEKPAGAGDPAISNATTANASVNLATAGRYRFKYVVTDNSGTPSADAFVTEYVYAGSGVDVKVYSDTLGGFTVVGAADAVTALNDALASSYLESSVNPVGVTNTATMCPYGPGDVSVISSGYANGGAVTRRVQIRKEDGTTVVYTKDIALTNTDADYTVQVDSAGLALIPNLSDRRALVVITTSTAA